MLILNALLTAFAFGCWVDTNYKPQLGAVFVFCFILSMGTAFKGV